MYQQLRMLAALETEVDTEGIEWNWKRMQQIMKPGKWQVTT